MKTRLIPPSDSCPPIMLETDTFSLRIMPYHLLRGGSHKRISYYGMLRELPDGVSELVESSTGNSAIAAAAYAKELGLPITVFLPEGMAQSKLLRLEELGARAIFTPTEEYTQGARIRAQTFTEEKAGRFMLNQARNPGNSLAHEEWAEKLGQVDCFVCGGGTYGTIRGYSEALKKRFGPSHPGSCH